MNSIEAVIFDMDGLMLDTERLSQQAWQKAGRDLGFDLPPETTLKVIGRVITDIKGIMAKDLGEDFPIDAFVDQANIHYHRLITEEPLPTKAGLYELLDFLEEHDVPKAVATSTRKELAVKKLESVGIAKRFRLIVGGDEVKQGKPAPDIFLKAAEGLGVEPDNCVVLEDSEMGIRGAHAAGMHPIMVPDLVQPSDEVRELTRHIFTSLPEFMSFFSQQRATV